MPHGLRAKRNNKGNNSKNNIIVDDDYPIDSKSNKNQTKHSTIAKKVGK